jgi:3'(2'), 5'-bisphosphate nucleotidase
MNHSTDPQALQNLIPALLKLAKQAGDAIMDCYQKTTVCVEIKADRTPVTQADKLANDIIYQGLLALTPHIPIISEEETAAPFQTRQHWPLLWLVDPLDGTKEFLHHTDEFTVNIALIADGYPIIGIIYAPVLRCYYFASRGNGAFKQQDNAPAHPIHTRPVPLDSPLTVIASRRHAQGRLAAFTADFPDHVMIHKGSSLKSCLIAEGQADIYPCLGPTCEWDMAAAQCILEEAGGKVMDAQGQPFRYNVKPTLVNPPLVVVGDKDYDWGSILKRLGEF